MLNHKYNKILVGVDGSEISEDALREAITIAKRNDSHLYIAHISDPNRFRTFPNLDRPFERNQFMGDTENQLKEKLESYVELAREEGLEEVEYIIRSASPKTELATVLPEEYAIDLVILGATGINRVERVLVGSVSSYVIHNTLCNVLIVRAEEI